MMLQENIFSCTITNFHYLYSSCNLFSFYVLAKLFFVSEYILFGLSFRLA